MSPSSRASSTYSLVVGLVTGALLAGVAVPFALGERPSPDVLGAGGAGVDAPVDAPADGGVTGGLAGPDGTVAGAPDGEGPAPVGGAPGGAPGSTGGGSADAPATGPATTGGGGAPGTAPRTGGGAAGPNTASDVGVTPTTIKLGVITPDTRTLEQLGYPVSPGNAPEQWKVVIDQLNARGGINGRKVVPVIRPTDVVNQDRMRETCRFLTEDQKVFAVVGTNGFYGDAVPCITKEHGTPFFLNDGQSRTSQYKESRNRLFTLQQNKDRTLENYVEFLDRTGALKKQKIGVLQVRGFDSRPVEESMLPLLKSKGYAVASRYTFSDDNAEAARQMAVAVNQMRQDGVTVVLPIINFLYATQFVSTADGQGYRPRYYTSDFAQGTSDFFALRMPSSFEGTLGVTGSKTGEGRVGIAESAADRSCREAYEKASGTKVSRTDSSTSAYAHLMSVCAVYASWSSGAARAGGTLTRDALAAGIGSLGPVTLTGRGGGSYRPGKLDGVDFERVVSWRADCKCWTPVRGSTFYRSPR
jgi:ABC-type branched-subunit amino acid transport system substrate-binding protein